MLTLCLVGAAASAQSPARELKRQQVILSSDTTAPPPRVRLSPDVLTLFIFDAAIDAGALRLEGQGTRLSLVDAGERSLLVKPLVELAPGEALLLAVPFKDGLAPASASFVLVSSPEHVDERVEVLRQPLSAAACQEQLEKERRRCAQQDALIAELRARASASDAAGLIFSGRIDEAGVSGTRSMLSRSPGIQHGLQVVEGEGVLGLRASRWAALALKVRNLQTPEALYAVVEYVGGRSLETAISFSMMRQRNYSEAFALYVCAELAAALAHAHSRADEAGTPLDIVHRDLCPARIRLDSHGRVKLCEFGLASSRLRHQRATSLWRARGDVFYASPEQLLGGKVDARSDLFCVGLLLLELTTGNHLFAEGQVDAHLVASMLNGLSPEQRQEIATRVKEELPACSEYLAARAATLAPEDVERAAQWLPAPVKVILHKLLCRMPADRYPSAVELERDLRARLGALDSPYGAAQALAEVLGAHSDAEELRDEVDVAEEGVLPPAVRETPLDEATTEPM